jgi:anti-sigma factor RsiW
MTCDSVEKAIPLYFYGELTPDDEDRLEQHLHECASCAREMDRQRAISAALESREAAIPPLFLEDCRADLMAAILGGAPRREHTKRSAWSLLLDALGETLASVNRVRTPVGALAMIALGFFAARITGVWSQTLTGPVASAGVSPTDDVFATVRSVRPDSSGQVQIAFDETRRRVISGRPEEQAIQRLLLAAAHEENASVRVESVDLLKERCNTGEVRDAFLNAVVHDPNDAVRLKALEGLKGLAGDPAVRKTLSQVLVTDNNPAVRMQVVDLLVAQRDDSVVGVLQGLVQREGNHSVRLKVEKALKDMNASIGTF